MHKIALERIARSNQLIAVTIAGSLMAAVLLAIIGLGVLAALTAIVSVVACLSLVLVWFGYHQFSSLWTVLALDAWIWLLIGVAGPWTFIVLHVLTFLCRGFCSRAGRRRDRRTQLPW